MKELKHIELECHFIRGIVKEKIITLVDIPSLLEGGC